MISLTANAMATEAPSGENDPSAPMHNRLASILDSFLVWFGLARFFISPKVRVQEPQPQPLPSPHENCR
ncbi:hypothetical protein V6N13_129798 [Hibiscus sabdariffa]